MKLKSIHLYQFLSHQDTRLELAGLACLRGENGAGKSSIEQGLEMLLTGRSESTDDKGTGSRDLIRGGCDKSAVTVEIQDATLLGNRTAEMRCSITEKSGRTIAIKDPADEAWTGGDFITALAAKREILDCLTNGRYFPGMDDKRQKALLAGIILPASAIWEDWVESAVNQCNLRVDWTLKPFDLIASAYDQAFEERKLINRLIKGWQEPEPVPAQVDDIAAIRARLSERQDQRTALAVKREKLLGKFQKAGEAKARAGERLLALQKRLTEELHRKSEVDKSVLSKAKLQEAQETAKRAETAKKLDEEIQVLNAELSATKRMLKSLDELGESGKCPTCTQPISDEVFEKIAVPVKETMDKLLASYNSKLDQRRNLGDYEAAAKVIAEHIQAEKQMELVQKHIDEVEEDIRGTKAEAEKEPVETVPDTSEIDAQIADLDARIQKGNAALIDAVQANDKRTQYATAMENKAKLDAKHALLEKLLVYFGPKGVQAKLLDEHVGGFQTSMNKVLANWGFEANLQFEPYQFGVRFAGHERLYTLKTISKSQKAMFAIAFQVALAKVSGLNFVVVDEADIFLDTNRSMLYRGLVAAQLDQVIVMQSDNRREIPKAPNSVFYMLTLDREGDVPTTRVERLA